MTVRVVLFGLVCLAQLAVPASMILRGEQAIRPAVVNRKVWGGNRTWLGANAQSVLTSVIQTCRLRLIDPFQQLIKTLTTPTDLIIPRTGR